MGLLVQQATQLSFGDTGCTFGTRTAVTVGSTFVPLGLGWWLVETDSHGLVKFTYDSGSNYVQILGSSAAGFVYSDGYNVGFVDDGTSSTCHYSQLLGSP